MHFYDTYETKDGKWMAVGALEPQFYQQFIEGLGLNIDEIEQIGNFESNRKIIAKTFKEKTREEWCNVSYTFLNQCAHVEHRKSTYVKKFYSL